MSEDIYSMFQKPRNPTDFEAIRIKLASPERIREWSFGEVTKPETINYRTFKPERAGLFCAKIFGPIKDWECICGKYKRIKHRGILCDKCGVEVIQSKVRRERLGHIELASPVAHVWYLKRPSIIGAIIDMSTRDLEKVLYFETYIITDPGDTTLKFKELLSEDDYKKRYIEYGSRFNCGMGAEAIRQLLREVDLETLSTDLKLQLRQTRVEITKAKLAKRLRLVEAFRKSDNKPEWMIMDVIPVLPPDLRPLVPLEGGRFTTSDLNDLYRRVINRNNRLKRLVELKAPSVIIKNEKRQLQEAVDALFDNGRRSNVLKTATKRPLKSLSDMISGKEGRFRQNLLGKRVDYSGRSVIVPDPTLKLHQCGLPKRMAMELFKPFVFSKLEEKGYTTTIKAAKKLFDKAKKTTTLHDFIKHDVLNKEAIYNRLIELQNEKIIKIVSHNISESIKKIWDSLLEIREVGGKEFTLPPSFDRIFSELRSRGDIAVGYNSMRSTISFAIEVWDSLAEVVHETPILLNRQPTLHKFGMMAFDPILVEGKAIRLHPLVCKAFNADFDGDQMAVHVPLSLEAQTEARVLMSSVNNIISPAAGMPVITPTQDIVLGIYYLTNEKSDSKWNGMIFSDLNEVRRAYDAEVIAEHTKIKVRIDNERIETTTGRVLFREILPCGFPFSMINKPVDKALITNIISYLHKEFGQQDCVEFLNKLMGLGFEYATKSGISICMDDIVVPQQKQAIIEEARKEEQLIISSGDNDETENEEVQSIRNNFKEASIEIWQKASNLIMDETKKEFKKSDDSFNSIYMMLQSGARGRWEELSQIAGMKGLGGHSSGAGTSKVITSNYKEGFSSHDFFMAAPEAIMGLAQTSLAIANAGYLLRRLIDVTHDIIIAEEDCESQEGMPISELSMGGAVLIPLEERIVGRISVEEVRSATGEIILKPNEEISEDTAKRIIDASINHIRVRSVLTCRSAYGICAKCFGNDLSTGKLALVGEPIGILAAQSIGEPTEQIVLNDRHGHTRNNAHGWLPRIVDFFEARKSKEKSAFDLNKIIAQQGLIAAQISLLNELQGIYRINNLSIHDKHFEIIIRKMSEKIRVEDPGDTVLLRGAVVHRQLFHEENANVAFDGGRPAKSTPVILGITKASLSTDSFISAASFQETTRVLTQAAINGAIDELRGLKENVIMGRLIPAGTGLLKYRNTFVKSDLLPVISEPPTDESNIP